MPSLSLVLDGTQETISLAGVAIQALSSYLEIPCQDCRRVDFAVTEALNNIVEHGYKDVPLPNNGDAIRLDCCYEHHKITISLVDRGVEYDPPTDVDISLARLDREDGRGWPIIRRCVDELFYDRQDNSNVLVLIFFINRS